MKRRLPVVRGRANLCKNMGREGHITIKMMPTARLYRCLVEDRTDWITYLLRTHTSQKYYVLVIKFSTKNFSFVLLELLPCFNNNFLTISVLPHWTRYKLFLSQLPAFLPITLNFNQVKSSPFVPFPFATQNFQNWVFPCAFCKATPKSIATSWGIKSRDQVRNFSHYITEFCDWNRLFVV